MDGTPAPGATTLGTQPSGTATSTRAAAGSFIGGVVEWYDFFIYGTAAALVLNDVFFPDADPAAGTLLALATFGIAYLARPVGGIVFGHIGDRMGRRAALVATLMLMGVATFLIGVLPTHAAIGVWAPAILVVLRLAQGLAAGGELGGASALAVEHAPPGRRGFFGAFAMSGSSAGIALGSGVFALVLTLPEDQFLAWGWRVPFLLSALVVVVGFVIRRKVPEPEVFVDAVADPAAGPAATAPVQARLPLLGVLRTYARPALVAVVVYSAQVIAFYLVTVYSVSYARANLDVSVPALVVSAVTLTTLANIAMNLVWGALSDRVGRRPVLIGGAIVQAVFLFAFFAVLPSGNFLLILAAMLGTLSFGQAAIVGVVPAYFSEMFGTTVRVTGIGLGVGVASIVGGFTPLVAAAVAGAGGGWVLMSSIAAGVCVAACGAVLLLRETRDLDITRIGEDSRG
ncbi:MFS transporter [Pseudonocardia sp. ICBG601]|uniref:MFS transporter n=1 Tax=Pseudonocardia sp. ICBG601 TaxID=2846759 RepID=UPI001CF6767E|nr:MFS transporter [Pseudonocardia sp. ICBG601]